MRDNLSEAFLRIAYLTISLNRPVNKKGVGHYFLVNLINLPQDYVLDFYLLVRLEAGTLH